MTSGMLKWVTILLPAIAITIFDYVRHTFWPDLLHLWPGTLLLVGLTVAGASLLTQLVFGLFERRKRSLLQTASGLLSFDAIAAGSPRPLDLEQVVDTSLMRVLDLLHLDGGAIFLLREPMGNLVLAGQRGLSQEFVAEAPGMRLQSTALVRGLIPPASIFNGHTNLEQLARREGLASLACVPLRSGEKITGIAMLGSRKRRGAFPYDQDLLMMVGQRVGLVIDSARLFQQVQRREREAEALYEVGIEISALLDLDNILDSLVGKTRELLQADCVALNLLEEQSAEVVVRASSGGRPEDLRRMTLKKGQGLAGRVISTGHLAVEQYSDGSSGDAMVAEAGVRYCLGIPLKMGEKAFGALCVGSRTVRAFSEEETNLLSRLANQASIAIANTRLYERAQNLAVLEERDRIAREMHDSLAQVLGFLNLKARSTREMLSSGEVSRAQGELGEMVEVAEEAYDDVREAILGLRDSISPALGGLMGSLAEYLNKFSRQSKVAARLVIHDGGVTQFSPTVEVQLIRVIQEALTNVRKHARASKAQVSFDREDGWAKIVVEDDGRGFDLAQVERRVGQRFGIHTMRERIESVGGTLTIESAPQRGTKVIARLPLENGGTSWNR